MKKKILRLAAILLAAAMFAGCGSTAAQSDAAENTDIQEESTRTDEQQTEQESAAEAASAEPENAEETAEPETAEEPEAVEEAVPETEVQEAPAEEADRTVEPESNRIDAASCELSPEWVTELEQAQDADQLFIVAGVGKTTVWVSMHEKDENGTWHMILTTPGFMGKNGLGKTREGDGMTPVGTFCFNRAFGIAEDPGCAIPYYQVTEDDYWSGDYRDGYHYNEMVSIKDYPDLDTDNSEHIIDYIVHYQYCLNISYNAEGTAGLGSAIFLHCLGPNKPYSGGCVAIPQDKMITVMQNVQADCVVVIDSLETLSPDTWAAWGLG